MNINLQSEEFFFEIVGNNAWIRRASDPYEIQLDLQIGQNKIRVN